MSKVYNNPSDFIRKGYFQPLIDYGYEQSTEKWQGIKPPMPFWETLNVSATLILGAYTRPDITYFSKLSKQLLLVNENWANLHFEERVGRMPLNPGESYKIWPFYGRDKEVRKENEKFSHTYMERFWPKFANIPLMNKGDVPAVPANLFKSPLRGIRFGYGDLEDVINLLNREPDTRQAFLPIFFPEDTGANHGGRIPCSIGYHFIIRHGYIHCTYWLRSCDAIRHLADDLYLAVKLMSYVANRTNRITNLGTLTTHITSLHIFKPEVEKLKHI